MMTELEQAIARVYEANGSDEMINKAYVVFFRSEIVMPVSLLDDQDEPFSPLYIEAEGKRFIPLFDSSEKFEVWLASESMDHVKIKGADIIRGVGVDKIYLALNPGSLHYKEFEPDEIVRLKTMLKKLDVLKAKQPK